ncbi:hypothetical protein Pmi06nite_75940 [Planotetraspora mira]|uniref:Uncharacterized protein n=1 Tax=Planotetraspora mira TaxID=58121 RepID=A0A8J3TZI4_9ACTN|nr:hypothetical protein Pmi06nite_75940 [Planotetraspora mira]
MALPSLPPVPIEPAQPSLIFELDCVTPPQRVLGDATLGDPFLFDPRASVAFTGRKATVTMWVDGFKAHIITIDRDTEVRVPQRIDLTHKFYPVAGSRQHKIKAVLKDSAGRTLTRKCSFPLRFG